MSLPSRPIAFGRSQPQQSQFVQQHLQAQQVAQQQAQLHVQQQKSQEAQPAAPQTNGLNIALPGSSNFSFPSAYALPPVQPMAPPAYPSKPQTQSSSVAGPSSSATPPAQNNVPATPVPLTLEQQHITAVEGIIPTLQNIVATVNLDCRLDLKTIALHARNAEYNPKVSTQFILTR